MMWCAATNAASIPATERPGSSLPGRLGSSPWPPMNPIAHGCGSSLRSGAIEMGNCLIPRADTHHDGDDRLVVYAASSECAVHRARLA
jgi:hypothetical protein